MEPVTKDYTICEDDAAEFNPGVADLMSRAPVWSDLGPDIHGYRTLWIRTLTLAVILLSGTAVFLAGFLIGRLT